MYCNSSIIQTCSLATGKPLIKIHFLLIMNLQTGQILHKVIKGILICFFQNYVEEVENMISSHASIRKSRKLELFENIIICTNSIFKEKPLDYCKNYRNMISTFLKQSEKITMRSILKVLSIT